jgi:autotransporter-associated beta strand protein
MVIYQGMNRRNSIPVVVASFLCLCCVIGQAQPVTYTWTGQGMDNNWYNDANWNVTPAPDDVLTANVIFGDSPKNEVNLYANSPSYAAINIRGLTITGNTRPYYLDGDYDGYLTMTIGAGGITYSPAQPVRSMIAADFEFSDDQTWNIASGTLLLEGRIYDGNSGYTFTKTGAGTLALEKYDNSFTAATIHLDNGRLALTSFGTYRPLGSADLIIGPATLGKNPIIAVRDVYYNDSVTLSNNITLNGALTTENQAELNLTGQITLNADTTIKSSGNWLMIDGPIADGPAATPPATAPARKLTIDTNAAVILAGTNTYSGGTHVQNGVLVFATVGSLPALPAINALSSSSSGYIGFGDGSGASPTSPQGLFVDRFNKALTFGTIGFDTDPELSVSNNYSGAISLTGFATSARLGSATHAILSGTITPQGAAYHFGGGGGKLEVQSALTDAVGPVVVRNVVLDSPAASPLTVRFTSTGNNFTGGVSATHSAAIFGAGALPATGLLTLGTGGYIGVNDIAQGSGLTQAFINRFATTTNRGMIGFDASSEHVTVTDNISLAGFTDATPGIYLGTASRAHLDGSITPQGSIYRFAAYKGGFLTVNSILAGAGNSVHIGDPSSLGTMGNFQQQEYSTVRLAGNNTHEGTTTLYTGRLQLGHASALGTGALIVQPHSLSLPAGEEDVRPELRVDTGLLTIANAINLNADLNIGGSSSTFTLSGPVSGPGELYLDGDYNHLTLSGNNSAFSGGIYMSGYNSALTLGSNNAAGTGPLGFGYTSRAAVYFSTTAPVIGGLMSKEDGDYANLYATQTNTVLTINQPVDSVFRGEFRSSAYPSLESMRLVKAGPGTLRLENGGMYFYNGTPEATLAGNPEVSLQVKQGTLVIGNNFNMQETSSTTIWVNGGTLALDRDPTYYYNYINNPIVVDNNGRLAGNGAFNSSIKIGAGAILAPGHANQDPTGLLAIDHLELNSGGLYEWQIQDPSLMGQVGRDLIQVGLDDYAATLVINAGTTVDDPLTTGVNEDTRFTLKVISLTAAGTPGLLSGFDPTVGYSWMLFNYDAMSPTAGFDPAKFNLDASGFANSLVGGPAGKGVFYLTDTGNSIMLNFAPVPEPSTYALMLLGLGFLGLTVWRRRRA